MIDARAKAVNGQLARASAAAVIQPLDDARIQKKKAAQEQYKQHLANDIWGNPNIVDLRSKIIAVLNDYCSFWEFGRAHKDQVKIIIEQYKENMIKNAKALLEALTRIAPKAHGTLAATIAFLEAQDSKLMSLPSAVQSRKNAFASAGTTKKAVTFFGQDQEATYNTGDAATEVQVSAVVGSAALPFMNEAVNQKSEDLVKGIAAPSQNS